MLVNIDIIKLITNLTLIIMFSHIGLDSILI